MNAMTIPGVEHVRQLKWCWCGPAAAEVILAWQQKRQPLPTLAQQGNLWESIKSHTSTQYEAANPDACCAAFDGQRYAYVGQDLCEWWTYPTALRDALKSLCPVTFSAFSRDDAGAFVSLLKKSILDENAAPVAVLYLGWQHWIVVYGVGLVDGEVEEFYVRDSDSDLPFKAIPIGEFMAELLPVPAEGPYLDRIAGVFPQP